MDYMLKSNDEINDPLSKNNLDKTLDLVNEFRLSSPRKSIWLYTGYAFEDVMEYQSQFEERGILDIELPEGCRMWIREQIISQCRWKIYRFSTRYNLTLQRQ